MRFEEPRSTPRGSHPTRSAKRMLLAFPKWHARTSPSGATGTSRDFRRSTTSGAPKTIALAIKLSCTGSSGAPWAISHSRISTRLRFAHMVD